MYVYEATSTEVIAQQLKGFFEFMKQMIGFLIKNIALLTEYCFSVW